MGAELILFLFLNSFFGEGKKSEVQYKNERLEYAMREEKLRPRYSHLAVYVVKKTKIENYSLGLPYYLVNTNNHEAYHAPSYILEYADLGIIDLTICNSKEEILEIFKEKGITVKDKFPNPKELGMEYEKE